MFIGLQLVELNSSCALVLRDSRDYSIWGVEDIGQEALKGSLSISGTILMVAAESTNFGLGTEAILGNEEKNQDGNVLFCPVPPP